MKAPRSRRRGPSGAQRLAGELSSAVFPRLARALAAAAPAAPPSDVRDAALVLLFRLLFVLCAEDLKLLPAGDPRYDAASLRRIRKGIAARRNRGEAFSAATATAARHWFAFDRLCRAIAAGDPAIGVPPCGGLFDAQRAPLLAKISLGDNVMADVIDALSFEPASQGGKAIDHGAVDVRRLGGLYERLLDLEIVRNGADIVVRPDITARRTSGSYYTPDALVALIIRETVGPLAAETMAAFQAKAEELAAENGGPAALQRLDPASQLLDLRVCDPAMGAGHFLVSLIDDLTGRAIAAMAEAEAAAADAMLRYVSPLRARIAAERSAILQTAATHGIIIDPAPIDDRSIIRRMVAARCVYGVDKNPMAVELAKAALQLHTFTPGAPPVFLDHHLRCGDSLFSRFFNWQTAFPDVWPEPGKAGGFDAVIGNPPWDRMKLQQVEWFAARRRDIAMAPRAADRSKMIAALRASGDPLAQDYAEASACAEAAARMARTCGDYPLMSGGDVNLYSLFVERAMALVNKHGLVGLLVPSGIASDKTASPFFKAVATGGRLRALYDFENRRTRFGGEPFFPGVDGRFKFCAFVAGRAPRPTPATCAFFLQDVTELADEDKCFALTAEDFARVNPNTGTAPVFRSRRDAGLTMEIYRRFPALVDRSSGERKAWPVRYMTMFHMTNDSRLFRTGTELTEQEKATPAGGNRWQGASGLWLPLYEGKMAQAFDHRAAGVAVNAQNRHRPAQPAPATLAQHQDPAWLPEPQYWVEASRCGWAPGEDWVLGFKEITAPTNARTVIAALFPAVAFGNKIPLLRAAGGPRQEHLLCANLNSFVFDFVARQKIHGQTLNRFVVEQLPVIPPDRYERRFGSVTAAELVRDAVLELTYTSHDMAPFAAAMGFVDASGAVRPPFAWDEARRAALRAKLDAIYFLLYGVAGRNDVRYVYSTFPIVARDETGRYGRFLSRDLCLAWMDALEAGEPDVDFSTPAAVPKAIRS